MFILVSTNCSNETEALDIADAAVRLGLAACAHVTPHTSIYRWAGNVVRAPEFKVELKAVRSRWEELSDLIRRMHSYERPCIQAVEVGLADPEYLAWIVDNST